MSTSKSQSHRNNEESKGEARYLLNDKKRYYLASVDQNVQQLINHQKEELTQVLIEAKSEYDKLVRESKIKTATTEELDKKIAMLELVEAKKKKKYDEINETNETMKNVLELKRKKKEEEQYNNKTLIKQIEKLKNDTFLIQKDILDKEVETKRLRKIYDKERAKENDIRERTNNVNFKIQDQNIKNKHEKNEQDLQIEYYKAIIEQKEMFIKSADERKEKQAQIAQQAKNDSQDKQEVEKRKELQLVMLYNTYLRHKMEEQLKTNEKMEETFSELRDICGTTDLKFIVDKILNKDKEYNYCVSLIRDNEKEKVQLKNEIAELQEQFIELKNEVLIDEETEENFKNINAIHIDRVEEDEEALIKKERELTKTLFLLQQKHKDINLAYENVMENMRNLIAYQDDNINPNHEELKEEEEEEHGQIEEEKNAEEKEAAIAHEEEKQNEETEEKKSAKDEAKPSENADEAKPSESAVGEEQALAEGEKKETDDNGLDTLGNVNTNEETVPQQQETVVVEETPEETELINKYHTFLKQALKTFNILFLCHSKQEFLNLMNAKGMEMQQEKEKLERMQLDNKKKGRRSTRKRLTNTSSAFQKPSAPLGAEEEDEDKEIIDKDILNKFMREIKKSREDFVTGDNKPKFAIKK